MLFLEGSQIVNPEIKHAILVRKVDGQEFIIPVSVLKETFGDQRYMLISSGVDPQFTSFPYEV